MDIHIPVPTKRTKTEINVGKFRRRPIYCQTDRAAGVAPRVVGYDNIVAAGVARLRARNDEGRIGRAWDIRAASAPLVGR